MNIVLKLRISRYVSRIDARSRSAHSRTLHSCWLCVQMSGRDARWARVSRWARCSPWHPFWPTTKINGGSPSTANSNTRTPIWRPAPCKDAMPEIEPATHADTCLDIDTPCRVSVAYLAPRKIISGNHPSQKRKFNSGVWHKCFLNFWQLEKHTGVDYRDPVFLLI